MKWWLLSILLYGCTGPTNDRSTSKETPDLEWKRGPVSALDDPGIDSLFLIQQSQASSDTFIYANNAFVVQGDSMAWPWPAHYKGEIIFSSDGDSLIVTPMGRTALAYKYFSIGANGNKLVDSGNLYLPPLFYLAAEIEDNPVNGDAMGMMTYNNDSGAKQVRILISLNEEGDKYARYILQQKQQGGVPASTSKLLKEIKH